MRASISIRCTPRLSRLKTEQRGRNHPFRVRSEFFEAPAPACNHPKLPTGSSLMFSKNLELSISQAFHTARSKGHEYLTGEHMLLALLDSESVREVLIACAVDLEQLGEELDKVLPCSVPVLSREHGRDRQPPHA